MKRFPPILLVLLLFVLPVYGQAWEELAAAKIVNFDKRISGTDKMIFVQPPEGKYWIILFGSLSLEEPVRGGTFVAWLEDAPFAPYRDPQTGEMIGCVRCLTLVRVSTDYSDSFPIVGGYTRNWSGQTMPLVVRHPNRIGMMITPEHGGWRSPIQTWVRFQVVERDLN